MAVRSTEARSNSATTHSAPCDYEHEGMGACLLKSLPVLIYTFTETQVPGGRDGMN